MVKRQKNVFAKKRKNIINVIWTKEISGDEGGGKFKRTIQNYKNNIDSKTGIAGI